MFVAFCGSISIPVHVSVIPVLGVWCPYIMEKKPGKILAFDCWQLDIAAFVEIYIFWSFLNRGCGEPFLISKLGEETGKRKGKEKKCTFNGI